MTESIPVTVFEGWFNDPHPILKSEMREAKTGEDLKINQGMRHDLDRYSTESMMWLQHPENMWGLSRSTKRLLIARDAILRRRRYRKLERCEGDVFLTLA